MCKALLVLGLQPTQKSRPLPLWSLQSNRDLMRKVSVRRCLGEKQMVVFWS